MRNRQHHCEANTAGGRSCDCFFHAGAEAGLGPLCHLGRCRVCHGEFSLAGVLVTPARTGPPEGAMIEWVREEEGYAEGYCFPGWHLDVTVQLVHIDHRDIWVAASDRFGWRVRALSASNIREAQLEADMAIEVEVVRRVASYDEKDWGLCAIWAAAGFATANLAWLAWLVSL